MENRKLLPAAYRSAASVAEQRQHINVAYVTGVGSPKG